MSSEHQIAKWTVAGRVREVLVWHVALVFAAILQTGLTRANDHHTQYLNDMKILACVTAQNAVRARLKQEGPVGFESCASSKFDFEISADDRNYKVFGNAIVMIPSGAPKSRRFRVRINHNPGSYGEWGFEVTGVDVDP
jgi:hypothetical protein